MLDELLTISGYIIKASLLFILIEVVVMRLIPFYKGYLHYRKQGMPIVSTAYPIIGSFYNLARKQGSIRKDPYVPYLPMI